MARRMTSATETFRSDASCLSFVACSSVRWICVRTMGGKITVPFVMME